MQVVLLLDANQIQIQPSIGEKVALYFEQCVKCSIAINIIQFKHSPHYNKFTTKRLTHCLCAGCWDWRRCTCCGRHCTWRRLCWCHCSCGYRCRGICNTLLITCGPDKAAIRWWPNVVRYGDGTLCTSPSETTTLVDTKLRTNDYIGKMKISNFGGDRFQGSVSESKLVGY